MRLNQKKEALDKATESYETSKVNWDKETDEFKKVLAGIFQDPQKDLNKSYIKFQIGLLIIFSVAELLLWFKLN